MQHYRIEVNGKIKDVTSGQLRFLVERRFVSVDARIWVGARECLVSDVLGTLEKEQGKELASAIPADFNNNGRFNWPELDATGTDKFASAVETQEELPEETLWPASVPVPSSVPSPVPSSVPVPKSAFERHDGREVVEFLSAGEVRRSAWQTLAPILISVGGAALFFIVFLLIQSLGNSESDQTSGPDQTVAESPGSPQEDASVEEVAPNVVDEEFVGEESEVATDEDDSASPSIDEQIKLILTAFRPSETDATREIAQFASFYRNGQISEDAFRTAKVLAVEYVVGLKFFNRDKRTLAGMKRTDFEAEIRRAEERYDVRIARTGREATILGKTRVFCHGERRYSLDFIGFKNALRDALKDENAADAPDDVPRGNDGEDAASVKTSETSVKGAGAGKPASDYGKLARDVDALLDRFAESGDLAVYQEAVALAGTNRKEFETNRELSDVQKRLLEYQVAVDKIGGYVYSERTLKSRYPTLGYTYELQTLFGAMDKFFTAFADGDVVVTLAFVGTSEKRVVDELKITAREFELAGQGGAKREIVKSFGSAALRELPGAKCELVVDGVERFVALRFDSAASAKRCLARGSIGLSARTSDDSLNVAEGMGAEEHKLVADVSNYRELEPVWEDFLIDAVEPKDAWASKKPSIVVPDDASSIQQALEKSSDGDVVMIRSGSVVPLIGKKIAYGESVVVKANHSVQFVGETGDAKDVVVEIGDQESLEIDTPDLVAFKGITFSTVPASWGREILPSITADNGAVVLFRSCAFTGNGNEDTTGVVVAGKYAKAEFWKCAFEQYGQHAIRVFESPNVSVKLSAFRNGNHCGIYALDNSKVRIDKCLFEKNRAAIQATAGGGFTASNSYFIGNRNEWLVSAGSDKAYDVSEGNVIEK